jgi:hypothetical protein
LTDSLRFAVGGIVHSIQSTTQTRRERPAGQRIRRTVVGSLAAVMVATSSPAFPQTPFEDLPLRVNLDDQVRVEDRSGGKTVGRVTGLTADEIVVQTVAGESRFTRGSVREVAVRRYDLRRGAIIGAGVFAVLGMVAMCAHGEEHCAVIGPLAAAPIGAGVGLAFGALIPRMKTVYGESQGGVSVPPSPAGAQAGFLSDLALRTNLDDEIEVETASGVGAVGRLTGLTADEISMRTGAGERHFTREMVRRVSVRRRPIRMSALIGAGVGAAAGAAAACTGSNREECADAPIMAGALGAGLGLAAGALARRSVVVYPEADRQVSVFPLIARNAIGVGISRRW